MQSGLVTDLQYSIVQYGTVQYSTVTDLQCEVFFTSQRKVLVILVPVSGSGSWYL